MKILCAILFGLLMIAPCMALNDTENASTVAAYMEGLNAGYHFGYLAVTGQGNATAEAEYNGHVAELNSWMDQVGYEGARWGELPITNYTLPRLFSEPSDWYKTEV
jgi:hypothetical protein